MTTPNDAVIELCRLLDKPDADLLRHIERLDAYGLHPAPAWGGGKCLPGVNLANLADNPPSLDEALEADYSGGLSLICGTAHLFGGHVVGIDIDRGAAGFQQVPVGFLYAELGTTDDKAHLFVRVTDRLDGVVYLRDRDRKPVVELKGRGQVLRSWPTHPDDKPRAYQPFAWARDLAGDPPRLNALQLANCLADYMTRRLGEVVRVEHREPHHGTPRPTSGWLCQRVADELDRLGVRLGRPMASGWQSGRCPFHDDRHKSFSVNLERGFWRCHTGCGSGYMRSLARRLGVMPTRTGDGHLLISGIALGVSA